MSIIAVLNASDVEASSARVTSESALISVCRRHADFAPDSVLESVLEETLEGVYDLTPARRQVGVVFSLVSRRFLDLARTVMLREISIGAFDKPMLRPDALDFLVANPGLGCRVRKVHVQAMDIDRIDDLFRVTTAITSIRVYGRALLVRATYLAVVAAPVRS